MSDTGDAQAVESESADDAGATDGVETADEADEADDPVDAHLADVDDGCGCAEVWEHLSEQREE